MLQSSRKPITHSDIGAYCFKHIYEVNEHIILVGFMYQFACIIPSFGAS